MFKGHSYVQFLMQTSVPFDLHLTTLGKLLLYNLTNPQCVLTLGHKVSQ